MYSFKKSPSEIEKIKKQWNKTTFENSKVLIAFWETKSEIIENLLPPPLMPTAEPLALAFIAHYQESDFGLPCYEGALFIRAQLNGDKGNYCLAMHVSDDMSMAGGREYYGFPKKIANLGINREEKEAHAWSERLNTRLLDLKANLTGKFNDTNTIKKLMHNGLLGSNLKEFETVNFNYKHFISPEGFGFDYKPRLIREVTVFRPQVLEMGEVEITLKSTIHDPWGEIEVVKPMGAIYVKSNNTMLRGEVVAELDSEEFIPYSFLKWDWYVSE
ncbi:MAG: acetoacetate decarboxylase [Candidatus Lokiarchaeota archaeon]|nr:acetoacetate decarboxylase [Candidatus Lokiarchaeota archaeon]